MFAASKTASVSAAYQISRSLRFNSADSAYLNRTPASAGNRRTWTWSGWVKRGSFASQGHFMRVNSGLETALRLRVEDNSLMFYTNNGSTNTSDLRTTAIFRDPSAWYHIIFAIDTTQATASDRAKIYVNGVQQTSFSVATYPTQNLDTGFNQAVVHGLGASPTPSEFFNGLMTEVNFIDGQQLTPSSFGETNAQTGVWQPKAYSGSYGTNGFYLNFSDNSNTTPVTLGKDYSGQAGVAITGSTTASSTTMTVVSLTGVSVGNIVTGTGIPANTYVTATGTLSVTLSQAATSTNASVSYTFSGNNWTPNNFSVTAGAGNDSLVDSPTSYGTDTGVGGTVRGNYATLNPLNVFSSPSIANGNLETSTSGTSVWKNVQATIGMSSDKFYWESTMSGGGTYYCVGVAIPTKVDSTYSTGEYGIWVYDGRGYKIGEGGSSSTAYGATYGSGDVIGIALDLTAGTITFYKNGTSQGVAFSTGLTGVTVLPQFGVYYNGSTNTQIVNFGQRAFAYTAPSGFKALCTQNLPTPTIGATSATQANKYYDANLYTGNGSTQSITNSGSFQPDWVWIKGRSVSYSNLLFDAVRGTNKSIFSNNTNAEVTDTDALTAFNSNGFTMGAKADINGSGTTYVGWQWKANGAGSTNTSGSITSTVSANTTSGFSIVTYTGTGANATVGHGLGVAPSMLIIKKRSASGADGAWIVGHVGIVMGTGRLILNDTDSNSNAGASVLWNSTAASSTVFSLGDYTAVNNSGSTYVAYCFAPIAGYSAFGSYTGNGSADGPFVYTGFRPAYILIKRSSGVDGWFVMDSKRNTYNVANAILQPNNFATESVDTTNYGVDFLSNGFKIRNASTYYNASGGTLIYMAFAESPFKYSIAR